MSPAADPVAGVVRRGEAWFDDRRRPADPLLATALVGLGGPRRVDDFGPLFRISPPHIEPCCSQDSGHGPLNIGRMGGLWKCSKKTKESRFDTAGDCTFPTGSGKPLKRHNAPWGKRVSASATLGRRATAKSVGHRAPWLAVPPHVCRGVHITFPPVTFSKTWTFCIAFSLFRFLLISSLIHHPDVGGMKNKKKTGGGKRTCERLSDWRISFEHLSTWVTVDPSKSTCQNTLLRTGESCPNFTCQEILTL